MTVLAPLVLTASLLAAAASPEAPPPESPGVPVAEAGARGVGGEEGAADTRSWFVLPMVFWLPETKLGVAGSAGIHYRLPGARAPSNAFFVAGYTVEGQGSVDLSTEAQLRGGALLAGRVRAVHYPDLYYGIGPGAERGAREELTRRFVDLNVTAELPLVSRLRAGPRLNARAEEITELDPSGAILRDALVGAGGFNVVGFGLNVTWDSRDRPLWPSRGAYAQGTYVYYSSRIGRNEGFGRGGLEGRLFLPLGRERVLGLAAMLEEADGETPFTLLPKLGSTRFLRGIVEGRYRDAIAWAAQTEIRLPLKDRFSTVLFGAFGDVGPSLGALRAATLKVAGGAGLRYRLTGEGANLRLDVAGSAEGPAVYLLLLEAF